MKYPLLTDAQLDKIETEVNRYGTVEQPTETIIALTNALRTAKAQILAYEEVLSQVAFSQHAGSVSGRVLARNVLSKEF